MTIPVITPLPPYPATPPNRTQDAATFNTNMAAAFAYMAAAPDEFNDWADQLTSIAEYVDDSAAQYLIDGQALVNAAAVYVPLAAAQANTALGHANTAGVYASQALASKDAAVNAANFKGAWSSLSGALNVPASVYHNGLYWQLLGNLSNVALAEPGVSASWAVSSGDSLQKMVASILSGATVSLDFANNSHKVYEQYGLEPKQLTRVLTTVRATSATYVTPQGRIATALSNEPRITYSPTTGRCLGLLVESQTTNLLLRSQEFDNAAWTQNPDADVNVTANAITSPDGSANADKFFEATTTNTFHDLFQAASTSLTAGSEYTLSIFVKAAERFRGALTISAGTAFAAERSVFFNLQAGTVTAIGTGATVGIEPWPEGWFRVWVTATADSSGANNIYFRLQDASGNSVYAGAVNSGIYLFGAMLNAGKLQSYIPTTSAAVTVDADVISHALISTNANSGSIFVEFDLNGYNKIGNTTVVSLNGNPQTNERGFGLTIENNLVQAMIRNASGARSAGVTVVDSLQPMKALVSFDNVALKIMIAVNGVVSEVTNPTAVDIGAFVSHLYIAGGFRIAGATGVHSKTVKRCIYFPLKMNASDAQALTS